jgi:predicted dinucleotide-binding enzyme
MNITVIGKGNVGGGLAKLWRAAGHDVQEIGREGGDASNADVLLIAVPSSSIGDALGKVSGIDGKTTIDATNAFGGRNDEFPSLADEVKSIIGGPIAKAFNLNFASLYEQIGEQRVRPSMPYVSEDGARDVSEQLIRDAGYDPVAAGGLENARMLEDALGLIFAINQAGLGQFFYRMAKPGEL